MKGSTIAWVLAAVVSIVVIMVSWRSMGMLETIISEVQGANNMEPKVIDNRVTEIKKATCADVPTKCGFSLVFYMEQGETPGEFAARIKREVQEFEKAWQE